MSFSIKVRQTTDKLVAVIHLLHTVTVETCSNNRHDVYCGCAASANQTIILPPHAFPAGFTVSLRVHCPIPGSPSANTGEVLVRLESISHLSTSRPIDQAVIQSTSQPVNHQVIQ